MNLEKFNEEYQEYESWVQRTTYIKSLIPADMTITPEALDCIDKAITIFTQQLTKEANTLAQYTEDKTITEDYIELLIDSRYFNKTRQIIENTSKEYFKEVIAWITSQDTVKTGYMKPNGTTK